MHKSLCGAHALTHIPLLCYLIICTGKTYFFKGKKYWQLDDATMEITKREPDLSAHRWMGCERRTDDENEIYDNYPRQKEPLTSSAHRIHSNLFVIFLSYTFISAQLIPFILMRYRFTNFSLGKWRRSVVLSLVSIYNYYLYMVSHAQITMFTKCVTLTRSAKKSRIYLSIILPRF